MTAEIETAQPLPFLVVASHRGRRAEVWPARSGNATGLRLCWHPRHGPPRSSRRLGGILRFRPATNNAKDSPRACAVPPLSCDCPRGTSAEGLPVADQHAAAFVRPI